MTDASGSVVWAADYKPFGEATITVSTITNNIRFPGQYYEAETGLNYNYYRDYNTAIGRYVEADLIGIMGGRNHLYTYVGHNPIRFTDPLGLYLTCRQIRYGNTTVMICIDSTTLETVKYDITENAPVDPEAPYEENQQLAPGEYQLLPRPTQGRVLPQGSPVYTTPGQPAGTMITPSGDTRGDPPAGPHVGRRSGGCPLFDPTKEGRRQKEDFYRRFNENVNKGGTWVFITDRGWVFTNVH